MTQDDSHTFCSADQIGAELEMLLEFVLTLMHDFGYDDVEADLSTRPDEKWVGDLELWELAESSLAAALDKSDVPYRIAEGEGAFYGPKIDVHLRGCNRATLADVNDPARLCAPRTIRARVHHILRTFESGQS